MFKRGRGVIAAAPLVAAALFPAATGATSLGGCPSSGWELVTLASLEITPETATGIPSLDGNGDGLTCIHRLPRQPNIEDAFVFRDNTVGP